jgi:2-alkenal reductase
MVESPRRSGNLLLWAGLALLLLIGLGCILTFAAGAWFFMGSARTAVPTPRPAARTVATRAPAVSVPAQAVVIATPEGGTDYETAVLENIYNQVNPSVVNVTVLGRGDGLLPEEIRPPDLDPDSLLPYSSGSGFVWDAAGHIVTNNHVVEGADEVQVTFSDGTLALAEVIGADPDSDLAVLRIDPEGYSLTPVRLGRMEDVHVGMRVAAIGNPFGLEGTLTSGIVSAIGRSIPARVNYSIPDSIQTDTAINPGNSGGPLLNEQGEVIGVNAQIRSEVRSNSGVGFAIPVNVVERVVPALIENGVFAHSYMGVSGRTISPICADEQGLPKDIRGALVLEVLPDTPAERAGLAAGSRELESRYPSICPDVAGGDLIIAVDGEPVTKFDDVLAYLQRNTSPGDTITLTIWREGEALDLDLTLAARPGSVQ